MNPQQKRKNQKKHRDNIYNAFMEGVESMRPKTFSGKEKPKYDIFKGKKLK